MKQVLQILKFRKIFALVILTHKGASKVSQILYNWRQCLLGNSKDYYICFLKLQVKILKNWCIFEILL